MKNIKNRTTSMLTRTELIKSARANSSLDRLPEKSKDMFDKLKGVTATGNKFIDCSAR